MPRNPTLHFLLRWGYLFVLAGIGIILFYIVPEKEPPGNTQGALTLRYEKDGDGHVSDCLIVAEEIPLQRIIDSLINIYAHDIYLEPETEGFRISGSFEARSLDDFLEIILPTINCCFYEVYSDIFIIRKSSVETLEPIGWSFPCSQQQSQVFIAEISNRFPDASVDYRSDMLWVTCSPMEFNQIRGFLEMGDH